MSAISPIPNGVRSGSIFRSAPGTRAPAQNSREPSSDPTTTRFAASAVTQIDSGFIAGDNGSALEKVPGSSGSIAPPTSKSAVKPDIGEKIGATDSATTTTNNDRSTEANSLPDENAHDRAKLPGQSSNDRQSDESRGQVVNGKQLTPAELDQLRRLKTRDLDVRQHEQAHLAAGGSQVRGGVSFEYQTGSDGRQYAVSGEVQIDVPGKSGDLKATLAQLQQVRAAALAPVAPSGQDLFVASEADRLAIATRQEIQQQSAQITAATTSNLSENEAADELANGFPKTPSDIGQSLANSSLPQFPVHPPKPSAVQEIIDVANLSTASRNFETPTILGQEIDFTA